MQHDDTRPPLTLRETAAACNVSYSTVRRLVDAGDLKPIWIRGVKRITQQSVDDYLHSLEDDDDECAL